MASLSPPAKKGRIEASQAALTPVLRGLAIFDERLNDLVIVA
jgi:hypothetical protein